MMLTKMKLISITCERSVEQKIVLALKSNSVRSLRLSDVRVEELDGASPMDLLDSQIKIECLVAAEILDTIVKEIVNKFIPKYDIGFFVSDAEVLRPDVFCARN